MSAAMEKGAVPAPVTELLLRYKNAGYKAYLVGGCVRDSLLGLTPADFDIAVSATPAESEKLLWDCKIIPTGIKHGTLTVIYKGTKTEITAFRKEGAYTDHRHPDGVEFTDSAAEDAARRDFTVNALFYNPWEGIVDFYGGAEDLKSGLLRCVGEPRKRFCEDALRILRALRFASRFGFKIEGNTAAAMKESAPLIKSLAVERVLSELKLLLASDCDAYIADFPDIIGVSLGVEGKIPSVSAYPAPYRLPVFIAEYCGSAAAAVECISRLKPDGHTLTAVKAATAAVYGEGIKDRAGIARAARIYGAESARMMCAVCKNKSLPLVEDWEEHLARLKDGTAPLHLKDLGIKGTMLNVQGAPLGKLLECLYDYANNQLKNDTASLLEAAEAIQNQTEKGNEQ